MWQLEATVEINRVNSLQFLPDVTRTDFCHFRPTPLLQVVKSHFQPDGAEHQNFPAKRHHLSQVPPRSSERRSFEFEAGELAADDVVHFDRAAAAAEHEQLVADGRRAVGAPGVDHVRHGGPRVAPRVVRLNCSPRGSGFDVLTAHHRHLAPENRARAHVPDFAHPLSPFEPPAFRVEADVRLFRMVDHHLLRIVREGRNVNAAGHGARAHHALVADGVRVGFVPPVCGGRVAAY